MNLALLDFIALSLSLAASWVGAVHALLSKRDPRSAAAWVTLCLLFPLLGVLAYAALGNNRISARARRLQAGEFALVPLDPAIEQDRVPTSVVDAPYRNLERLARAVSGAPLRAGNCVEALYDGQGAYDAMLEAIESASCYVYFSSYIFEPKGIGERFVEALAQAQARGVDVRVLVDGIGERYSFPPVSRRLRQRGVPVLRFLPPRLLPPDFSINLRNHRKILVVDDTVAFTGGMNVRNRLLPSASQGPQVLDLHFRLRGPVVAQVREVFAGDWRFCGGTLETEGRAPQDGGDGPSYCRVITDGPSESTDKLIWVLIGAMAAAQHSIKIMTPYFLPSRVLVIALQTAAMRGVDVDVILPRRNNLRFMTWAAWHAIRPLVLTGVRVHFADGPFVHSKLLIIDDYYMQVGSANLDPRSLRLNFEIAVEIFDRGLGAELARHFNASLAGARRVTTLELARRNPLRRLRDAIVWLFSPYL